MIAHTQTMFGSIAWVVIIMGACLLMAGAVSWRNGMLTTGLGMFFHALAYIGFTLFGHASLWLTYIVPNVLLSLALACYSVSMPLIHRQRPPWRLIFSFPLLLAVLLVLFSDTQAPRQLSSSLVMMGQCLLVIVLSHRHALPGGRTVS